MQRLVPYRPRSGKKQRGKTKQLRKIQEIHEFFLVFDSDRNFGIVNKNLVVFNFLNVAEIDDIRKVHPKEQVGRQLLHDTLKRHPHEHFLVDGHNIQVVSFALDVQDIFDPDFNLFVPVFHKNKLAQQAILLKAVQLNLFLNLINGLVKPVELDGFEQIVDRLEVIAVDGIFGISRSENDVRFGLQFFDKLKSGDARHVNVEKNEIDKIVFQKSQGFVRIGKHPG